MNLKFPNARLHFKNLVVNEELSEPKALLRAACDFGLIAEDAVVQIAPASMGGCEATTKAIIIKHFEDKKHQSGMPQPDVEKIWSALYREAKIYAKEKQIQYSDGQRQDKSGDCLRFAAVLFDLMLQQIHRYP